MGWKSSSHRGVILEIKKLLQIMSNINTEILWTPGHAGLQGNDKADELAKTGAKEALDMPEEARIVTMQEDKSRTNQGQNSIHTNYTDKPLKQ